MIHREINFSQEWSLEHFLLPDILAQTLRLKRSGALTFACENRQVNLYFSDSCLVGADSTLGSENTLFHLQTRNRISSQQREELASDENERAAFFAQMNPTERRELSKECASEIVLNLMQEKKANVRFKRTLAKLSEQPLPLNCHLLSYRGLLFRNDPRELAKHFPFEEFPYVYFVRSRENVINEFGLDAAERGLISILKSNSEIHDALESSFLRRDQILRVFYLFYIFEIIKLGKDLDSIMKEVDRPKLAEKDLVEKNALIDLSLSLGSINYYQFLGIDSAASASRLTLENQIRRVSKRFEREAVAIYFQYQHRAIPHILNDHLRKIESTLLDAEQKREYDRFLAEGQKGDFHRDSDFKMAEDEMEKAKELENKGNYKEALRHVQNAIQLNKKKGKYYARLGELLYRAGKPDDAQILQKVEQCYKIAVNLSEASEACTYLCKLSDIYREREQTLLANSLLKKAIKLNPNSQEAIMRMNVYLKEDEQNTYLHSVYQNLDQLNYYQILNISTEPSLREIREGFLKRARVFHPDLYLQDADETRFKVDRIFKKVVEAYVSLRTPKQRGEPSELGRIKPKESKETGDAMSKQAKSFYDRAMMALSRGDVSNAKFNFKLALSLSPKSEELLTAMEGLE